MFRSITDWRPNFSEDHNSDGPAGGCINPSITTKNGDKIKILDGTYDGREATVFHVDHSGLIRATIEVQESEETRNKRILVYRWEVLERADGSKPTPDVPAKTAAVEPT